MPTFTLPLKDVLEHLYGTTMDSDDYELGRDEFTFQGVTYKGLPKLPDNGAALGLNQYPIFDEDYRPILNGKIIDEYFNREICTESIDDFILIFRRRMQQIMPYYNKMYESELLDYSALSTMDIRSQSEAEIDGSENVTANSANSSKTKSGARAVTSTTPQTQLAGLGDYASGGTDTVSESDVDTSGEQATNSVSESKTNSENRVTGFQGVAAELVARWRAAQINVDTLILSDLRDCFMQLLNNGDSYTPNNYMIGWYI